MNNKKIGIIISNLKYSLFVCYNASKKYFILKYCTMILLTVIPPTNIYLWKEIINGISSQNVQNKIIYNYLLFYLSLKLISSALKTLDGFFVSRYNEKIQFYVDNVLIKKTSHMDLSFFDHASMQDRIKYIRGNMGVLNQTTNMILDFISNFISSIIALVAVCSYKWWIGIIVILLLIPSMLYNRNHMKKMIELEKSQIRDRRKQEYFVNIFFGNLTQFEIKLNNIGHCFINRYNEIWTQLYKINKNVNNNNKIINMLFALLNKLTDIIILIISIVDVFLSNIDIGYIQYNLNMASSLREKISGIVNIINSIRSNDSRLTELREFIELVPQIERSGVLKPSLNPKIEFYNVSFRYPNSENYILKNCSFVINPYEKIGLVGVNGSGKSTIIKLLFRFYDPSSGLIKLDGIDLKEYDVYSVRRIFGVLFQDYVTYCLPFREIIALSDFKERFSDSKLQKACDISGVTSIIKEWEDGFDSITGRFYSDQGKDLSGGQWQLVGLARAYFKESNYMILDEPSAALDPISEDRIFKQLYCLSREKSSIIISHRLSNICMANKILVIKDGEIAEIGSHSELMKKNGEYAYLFRLQAEKYK